ncbi:uncharacterized protein [Gossypium hirsutum]|uniref:Retrovirus-related Pol polyprotein from transposon TNT 1-94 n=1 Tax=Gossypium hirsutum TaxID=3635 RepID=A0ABM3BT31_GOSHI|nr:uncharacterized protein LOC121229589 [Gossypium hirsutum]XP_040970218.1 uncharacterized protein LOC121229589 [Gossypium hirsutum]
MDCSSSLFVVQSTTPVMVSNLTNGVVDSRFFSTKKISVFLDDNNYLLWRQQVLLAIKIYKLQHFLDSQIVPPPQQLLDDTGLLQENPAFSIFKQQDNALAYWLLSSVNPVVLLHLIGLDTCAQIWNTLVNLYDNQTTYRLMFYRRALHSQRKADLSMKDFLMKIKGFCDSLASCGEVISEREHVTAILNSLLPDYESAITIITASQVHYTVQGVTSILLDIEARQ